MALASDMIHEVRTTGNDLNSGGFRATGTGTDYSQSDTPLIAFSDMVIDGTNANQVTSASIGFTSAHVGNTFRIASGTGFTTGVYQISSVSGGVATLDRNIGTLSSTGGTGRLGGAIATMGVLAAQMVTQNRAFVKEGLYTLSANLSFAGVSSLSPPTTTNAAHAIFGYSASRSDRGVVAGVDHRPTIKLGGTATDCLTLGQNGWFIEGLILDCNTVASSIGVNAAGRDYIFVRGVKVLNPVSRGVALQANGGVLGCEITGGNAQFGVLTAGSGTGVGACRITGVGTGIQLDSNTVAYGNIIHGNSSVGIAATNPTIRVMFNTIHSNGGHGISWSANNYTGTVILGNILTSNTGYGINHTNQPAGIYWDGNAFYNNSSGTFPAPNTTGVFGVGGYTNSMDVTLSGLPYTNAAGGDFSLNATANAGALLRGTAPLNAWPGLSGVFLGYRDFGAVQHQDTGGGGGGSGSGIIYG